MKLVISDRSGQIIYEGSPNLHGNGVKIGSGSDCDIQVKRMGIAKNQLHLRYNADGVLTLHDLQSPFGTMIDGVKLQSGFIIAVKPGSYIELTDEVFIRLQPGSGNKQTSPDDQSIFPFHLNANEQFVRKSFAKARSKLPREHYSAISAVEGEMVTKIKELSAVLEITYALNSITSFHRLLEFTLEMALAVTAGERAMLMLYNVELKRLETAATKGFIASEAEKDIESISRLATKCFESQENMIGPSINFRQSSRRNQNIEDLGIVSVAIVPLKDLYSNLGVLYIDTKHSGNILAAETEQLMKVFASQAAIAINRAKMFHAATTDSLTGVGNSNFFLKRLSEEFCRAQRYQKPISLILMDLDHFSAINSTHGERSGDKALKEVGKIFRAATRIHDLVARTGPDTFAMLLPETSFEGARIVAEKLKGALSETKIRTDNSTIQITGSFGLASSSRTTSKPQSLLRTAEKALKQARRRGGNQIA